MHLPVHATRWYRYRPAQLARDNAIARSTAYDYLHKGIAPLDALADQAPSLHGAMLAAKTAGYSHVIIDGTLIATPNGAAPCFSARVPGRGACRVGGPGRAVGWGNDRVSGAVGG